MSNRAITWAYDEVRGIGLAAKAVLVKLADQANDDGVCWPGKESLAEKLDCDKRTVDRAIAKLEALGLVRIRVGVPKESRSKTERNIYYLQIEQAGLFDAKGVAECQGWQNARGGAESPEGVAESPQRGGTLPSEPSINPQGNPKEDGGPDGAGPPAVYVTAKGKQLTGAALDRFERWWAAWDRYGNKAPAADAWLLVERQHRGRRAGWEIPIIAAGRREAQRRAANPEAAAKYGQGWLAERRWEDVRAPELNGRPVETAKPEWWQHWPGVLQVASDRYGILVFEFSEPPALLAELITRMEAAGDDVPEHLRNWLDAMRGTANEYQAAKG